jgi:hypothetical protein
MFRVRHKNHAGTFLSTHEPVGGTLRYSFRAGQPGDVSYTLPFSGPGMGRDIFTPYKTDFQLEYREPGQSGWNAVMGGIHVPINITSDEDAVKCAGKDWSHWLEQPVWFDYYNYHWNTAGDAFATRKRDVIKASRAITAGIYENIALLAFTPPASQAAICRKLIDNTKRGPNYVNINPKFTGNAGAEQLTTTSYIINFQDKTTVLQHINNIAALDDPYGFDWTMNTGKVMEFFGPRKTRKQAPRPIWIITKEMLAEQPMIHLDWTNNGPLGTHIVGLSVGSPALWRFKRDQESIDLYREWLRIEDVGDQYIKGPDMRYAIDGLDYIHPQKDVKIVVLPELLEGGFFNHIGDVIRVRWDFVPYHEVNAFYWINEQTYEGDAAGNWKMTLGLQQIYD